MSEPPTTPQPPAGGPPPDPRYDRYDDRDRDGGSNAWQLVAVALIALIIGGGAAYLIKDDNSGKTEVQTVQGEARTVTAPPEPDAVTVTQPPAETVVRTTVETVTVTVPTETTATEP